LCLSLLHGKYSLDDGLGRRYCILYYAKAVREAPVPIVPQGLALHTEFVSAEEEQALIREIRNSDGPWETYVAFSLKFVSLVHCVLLRSLALRMVKHWGFKFDYKTKLISPNCVPPIPSFFQQV
jgi:hypothetical protein